MLPRNRGRTGFRVSLFVFAQHTPVIERHDLLELFAIGYPVRENVQRTPASRQFGVTLDERPDLHLLGFIAERFKVDHFEIAALREVSCLVDDVSDSTAHTGREIAARSSEDDNTATRHVFASVVARAFHNGRSSAVTNCETLTGHSADERFTAGRSVKRNVADDDVFFGLEGRR